MAFLAARSAVSGRLTDLLCSARGVLYMKSFGPAYRFIRSVQRTVDNNSTTLTANTGDIPPDAYYAYVQVRGADIYWDVDPDRATPSSTVGSEAGIGDDLHIFGRQKMVDFRAVRQGATNATLKIQFYAEGEEV